MFSLYGWHCDLGVQMEFTKIYYLVPMQQTLSAVRCTEPTSFPINTILIIDLFQRALNPSEYYQKKHSNSYAKSK